MADRYVELHARSAFSFLEGSSTPEDLAEMTGRCEISAMALLDRNGVYGAPRFHMAAKKVGVKAHVGSEVTCSNGRNVSANRRNQARLPELVPFDYAHETTGEEGRRSSHTRGACRVRQRTHLPHARSQ